MSVAFSLTEDERTALRDIARAAITARLEGKEPEFAEPAPGILHEMLGSFVTLTVDGHLRGCIGTMIGHEPLWRNVARMAAAAAFDDGRFPPLDAASWARAKVELSVLGPLSPCPDVEAIEIGRHGLLLNLNGRSGVFLPKVPVEQGWDKNAYLENLCRKAGLPPGSWRNPQAHLFWYEALVFA